MITNVRRRGDRGLTIIEVTIALAVLAIGLLGMMRLHVMGINANGAARAHTHAMHLASELVAGLERLPFGDARLAPTGDRGPTPPADFGPLYDDEGAEAAGAHTWSDANPIPGVRSSARIGGIDFQRRWSVFGYSPAAGGDPTVKLVAVSVMWREPGFASPREVVLYTQLFDPSALTTGLVANQ